MNQPQPTLCARLWRMAILPHGVVIEGAASAAELGCLARRLERRGYRSLAYTRRRYPSGEVVIRATFSLPRPPQTLPSLPDK